MTVLLTPHRAAPGIDTSFACASTRVIINHVSFSFCFFRRKIIGGNLLRGVTLRHHASAHALSGACACLVKGGAARKSAAGVTLSTSWEHNLLRIIGHRRIFCDSNYLARTSEERFRAALDLFSPVLPARISSEGSIYRAAPRGRLSRRIAHFQSTFPPSHGLIVFARARHCCRHRTSFVRAALRARAARCRAATFCATGTFTRGRLIK